jgi:hypothetical protein
MSDAGLIGGALVVVGVVLALMLGAGVVVVLLGTVVVVLDVTAGALRVVVGVGGSPCASQAKPSRSRSSLRA